MLRPIVSLVAAALLLVTPGLARAKDIIGTAQDAGTFTILLATAKAAGLTEILSSPGPVTIFAPTDDAFAKIPREALQNLMKPENKEKLKAILLHHLVDGKATSRDFLGKRLEAATMQGQSLLIDATKGVTVDNAKMIKADIAADNGFIHVIDTVLIPK
ncbi:MAG: fasciclin domain-containing protein [Rhodospirillaceae bacterium]|nr:fasciclin domain-containing protein [Rhodospirillaceae bacterium]